MELTCSCIGKGNLNCGNQRSPSQCLHITRQIKARVFEVPGAGGCLLTEVAERLEDYYRLGSEVEVFHDIDEFTVRLGHLLAHPEHRDSVAWASYRRTQAEHTYEARFKGLLDCLQKKEIVAPIDFAAFDAIVDSHRIGKIARLLRAIFVAPFRLLWGASRGPRAARRLLFELSWRPSGRHTYMAAGWPGRGFYRES